MTPLQITPDMERAPWTDVDRNTPAGDLSRVGLLRHGTREGNASIGFLITLEDGQQVLAQTTWKLFRMAYLALAASPIVAEEVLDP